jgi:hypothetical protein
MNTCTKIVWLILLAFPMSSWALEVSARLADGSPAQLTSPKNQFKAGIIVTGYNLLAPYTMTGGFTITCEFSGNQQIIEQRPANVAFGEHIMNIPEQGTKNYLVAGWANVVAGQCHKGIITSALSVTLSGQGGTVTFGGGGPLEPVYTATFQMCKGANCQAANSATSLLTLSGVAQPLPSVKSGPLIRTDTAHDGMPFVLDEHALVTAGPNGLTTSVRSDGFRSFAALSALSTSGLARPTASTDGTGASRSGKQAVSVRAAQASIEPMLLIQHQETHPLNGNFTPVPRFSYLAQPIFAPEHEGQRGFAVVSFDKDGVPTRKVQIPADGSQPNGDILEAIKNGLTSNWVDERRHGHTVYLAYEIREQKIQIQGGEPFVTLPMCCRPEPCNPRCP